MSPGTPAVSPPGSDWIFPVTAAIRSFSAWWACFAIRGAYRDIHGISGMQLESRSQGRL